MVICLIQVNANSRKKYRLGAIILVSITIFGVLFAIFEKSAKLYELFLNGILGSLHHFEPVFTFSLFLSVALAVIPVVLLCIVLDTIIVQKESSLRCSLETYSKYSLLILLSFVCCLLSLTLSIREANQFEDKIKNILVMKYTNYSSSIESRRFVDELQTEYSCCGATSVSDFLDLSEIDGFENKLPPQTQLWSCSSWEYCSVPLSCCKSVTCSQRVEVLKSSVDLMSLIPQWFHHQGCIEAISGSRMTIPRLLRPVMLLAVATVMHLVVIVLTQIVLSSFASLKNSKAGQTEDSFAWLFDFGYPLIEDLMQADGEVSQEEKLYDYKSYESKADTELNSSANFLESETEKHKTSRNPIGFKNSESSTNVSSSNVETRKNVELGETGVGSGEESEGDDTEYSKDSKTGKAKHAKSKHVGKNDKKKDEKKKKKIATKKTDKGKKSNGGGAKKGNKKKPVAKKSKPKKR